MKLQNSIESHPYCMPKHECRTITESSTGNIFERLRHERLRLLVPEVQLAMHPTQYTNFGFATNRRVRVDSNVLLN